MVPIRVNDIKYNLKSEGKDLTLKEFLDFYNIIDKIPKELKNRYDCIIDETTEVIEWNDRTDIKIIKFYERCFRYLA